MRSFDALTVWPIILLHILRKVARDHSERSFPASEQDQAEFQQTDIKVAPEGEGDDQAVTQAQLTGSIPARHTLIQEQTI
jgi:hypothetical protein